MSNVHQITIPESCLAFICPPSHLQNSISPFYDGGDRTWAEKQTANNVRISMKRQEWVLRTVVGGFSILNDFDGKSISKDKNYFIGRCVN